MTEQEKKNRDKAIDLLNHYKANSHQALLGLLTDNCAFHIGAGESEGVVPYHGRHRGKQAIGAYLQKRRQYSIRDNCNLTSPGGKKEPNEPSHPPERLLVHGDTVVALGTLDDYFADGSHMHKTDFALVIQVDETQEKICFFQYFLDTAGAMHAWQHRRRARSFQAGRGEAAPE